MKSLKQIKEEYAIYHAYCDWNELIYSNDDPNYIDKCNDEVSKIHAKEVAKQALINASEKAVMCNKFGNDVGKFCFDVNEIKIFIDKQSILNESNIPTL